MSLILPTFFFNQNIYQTWTPNFAIYELLRQFLIYDLCFQSWGIFPGQTFWSAIYNFHKRCPWHKIMQCLWQVTHQKLLVTISHMAMTKISDICPWQKKIPLTRFANFTWNLKNSYKFSKNFSSRAFVSYSIDILA